MAAYLQIRYGHCCSKPMLFRTNNEDHAKPKLLAWSILLLIILIAGVSYLVLREGPGDPPPVPSPNFKSVNEQPL